jgi:hypothetical protein
MLYQVTLLAVKTGTQNALETIGNWIKTSPYHGKFLACWQSELGVLGQVYAATKATLICMAKVWVLEPGELGITANTVGQRPIRTQLFEKPTLRIAGGGKRLLTQFRCGGSVHRKTLRMQLLFILIHEAVLLRYKFCTFAEE